MNERELRLQPRLQCIADCVPGGARLADVGTDHGYLPVYLLRQGRIRSAIASDINAAPLAHARRTAAAYGVTLDLRLCAGLDGIGADEADTVVIAGMGGETIVTILQNAAWDWQGVTLLLQPMTKAELLRRWLVGHGLRITAERLVRDKGTIYAVLRVEQGQSAPLTRAEAWCGAGLGQDPLYGDYARDRADKLTRAAAGLRQAKTPDDALIASLEGDAQALRETVKEWEHANGT
ncbi:MAG: class I SAM-dependent methyltransferase [Oscillospiraceae bacterium]|nr:class I SAM-dependent methyltransferase [Oscillospiraceae bacterium]